jgi:hypothetical protein
MSKRTSRPATEFDARKFEFIGAPISDHVV